jgi:hypothetical protein
LVEEEADTVIGRLVDISKSGVAVLLPTLIIPGSLVKVELADALLFGRIIYASPGSGSDSGAIARFRTGIAVEQALIGQSDLSNLLKSLLEDAHVTFPVREE